MSLADHVTPCTGCAGTGRTRQMFTAGCGMGYYHTMAECEWCNGVRLVYRDTDKPVPASVAAQYRNTVGEPL